MPDELHEYLESKRAAIERGLRASLKLIEDAPVQLREAIEYGLLAPGKRLRPILVILAAEACGGTCEQAMSAAAAVEMIHAYSLIHDDLPAMDDDDLRRGRPTCHVRFGEALAILAGDGLLTLAFQVLADGYPARTAAACCRELSRAAGASGMVGGQVADLTWEGRIVARSPQDPNMTDLEMVHSRKTGALFQVCLRLGAIRSTASDTTVYRPQRLRRWTATEDVSVKPSRSRTTCSTRKDIPSRPESVSAKTRERVN